MEDAHGLGRVQVVVLVGGPLVLIELGLEGAILQILHHFFLFLLHYLLQLALLPQVVPLQEIRRCGDPIPAVFAEDGLEGALAVDFVLLLLVDFHDFLLDPQALVVKVLPHGLVHLPAQFGVPALLVIAVLLHALPLACGTPLPTPPTPPPFPVLLRGGREPKVWPRLLGLLGAFLQGIVLLVHFADPLPVGLEEEVVILHLPGVNYIIYYTSPA